jgi:hypothetical protein
MKKVSILLLLTVVLASFAFAIEGIGDFEVGLEADFTNVTGGNGGDLGIELYPYINFSRSFGAFGLEAELGDGVGIPTGNTADVVDIMDELYLKVTPSYSLAAGPGTLDFGLTLGLFFPITDPGGPTPPPSYGSENALFFRIDPSIGYGFDLDFGSLAFKLYTENLQISKNKEDGAEVGYGLDDVTALFQAGAELSFGLGFFVRPYFVIDTTDSDADLFAKIRVDGHYAITEQISAGLYVDINSDISAAGIAIDPYANFSFGTIGAGIRVDIAKVASDFDIEITPVLTVSYSF